MRLTYNTAGGPDFRRHFGVMPTVAAFAPGRIQLLGDHTDYNLGFTLSAAVDLGVTVIGRPRTDSRCNFYSALYDRMARFDLSVPEAKSGTWQDFVVGTVQEVAKLAGQTTGIDACIFSTVPSGGGVSSSAALEAATALFTLELWGLGKTLSPVNIARLCQGVDKNFMGVPTGILDQFSSMLGQPRRALFLDCRSEEHALVPFEAMGFRLFLVDSGDPHDLAAGTGAGEGDYRTRLRECQEAAASIAALTGIPRQSLRDVSLDELAAVAARLDSIHYRRAQHVLGENQRVLAGRRALEQGRLGDFATILNATYTSCRDLYQNSSPRIDCIASSAASFSDTHHRCQDQRGWLGRHRARLLRPGRLRGSSAQDQRRFYSELRQPAGLYRHRSGRKHPHPHRPVQLYLRRKEINQLR
jgi:galactokinase